MKKKHIISSFILVLCLIFTGCSEDNGGQSHDYGMEKGQDIIKASDSAEYFGTVLTITLYGDEEESLNTAVKAAFSECSRLESIFSAKLEDSELYMLNQTAYNNPVSVSEELLYVMDKALYYNKISDGNFDISIGKLIKLWGIGTESEKVPAPEEIEPFVNMGGCRNIIIDKTAGTVMYNDNLTEVDLGAIAKGYAADIIKEYLTKQEGITSGIINFGGNIMTIGEKPDKSEWLVGITNPLSANEVYAQVSVKDKCIVTSGNYERYFTEDGKKYHHILDPFTGYPAENGVISATVIGDNSEKCDAMSTICFILGVDKALELAESMEEIECILIDEAGNCFCSSGIEDYDFVKLYEEQ